MSQQFFLRIKTDDSRASVIALANFINSKTSLSLPLSRSLAHSLSGILLNMTIMNFVVHSKSAKRKSYMYKDRSTLADLTSI